MYYYRRSDQKRESFIIQVAPETSSFPQESIITANSAATHRDSVSPNKLNFSGMKLFNRFRKILMRLIFSFPSGGGSGGGGRSSAGSKQKACERYDPPKTSCSSYYSSQSHYSEAIADCIEFFNKSSAQEGGFEGRKSSDMLV